MKPSERVAMAESPADPTPGSFLGGCRFAVETRPDGDVVVAVIGDLDPSSARVLMEVVESTIGSPGTSRGLEIDLRRLRACCNSGIRALTSCAQLGARLRDGLHFRVGLTAGDGEYVPDGSVTLHT
jgi:hypothetical protein